MGDRGLTRGGWGFPSRMEQVRSLFQLRTSRPKGHVRECQVMTSPGASPPEGVLRVGGSGPCRGCASSGSKELFLLVRSAGSRVPAVSQARLSMLVEFAGCRLKKQTLGIEELGMSVSVGRVQGQETMRCTCPKATGRLARSRSLWPEGYVGGRGPGDPARLLLLPPAAGCP